MVFYNYFTFGICKLLLNSLYFIVFEHLLKGCLSMNSFFENIFLQVEPINDFSHYFLGAIGSLVTVIGVLWVGFKSSYEARLKEKDVIIAKLEAENKKLVELMMPRVQEAGEITNKLIELLKKN